MEKKIYKLWELPFQRPCLLSNALKRLNKADLKYFDWQGDDRLPARIEAIVELGVQYGMIQTACARVVDKGLLTFVDSDYFERQLNGVIHKVRKKELTFDRPYPSTHPNLGIPRRIHSGLPVKQSLIRTIEFFTSRSALLVFAETFCLNKMKNYIQLADVSPFQPSQIFKEIMGLLGLLGKLRPKQVLEIGTLKGGTLYLFSKVADPSAQLVSVDLRIRRKPLLKSFARKDQRVSLIEGDSTQAATINRIRKAFPEGIDFLFLDGDHSYDGIRTDFENYSGLLNKGGVIAFHDIVEDNETRYGVATGSWAGGVPKFWKEIKQKYKHMEFVQNWKQDGCGIGVLFI